MTNNYYQKQKKSSEKKHAEDIKIFLKKKKTIYKLFFVSNTFISNAWLKSTKIVNFCCLKIIHFLFPRYHPKIIRDIQKMFKKHVCRFK